MIPSLVISVVCSVPWTALRKWRTKDVLSLKKMLQHLKAMSWRNREKQELRVSWCIFCLLEPRQKEAILIKGNMRKCAKLHKNQTENQWQQVLGSSEWIFALFPYVCLHTFGHVWINHCMFPIFLAKYKELMGTSRPQKLLACAWGHNHGSQNLCTGSANHL